MKLSLPPRIIKRRSRFSSCPAATLNGLLVTHEVYLRIFRIGRKLIRPLHNHAAPKPKGT
jgi:hypothetical protein